MLVNAQIEINRTSKSHFQNVGQIVFSHREIASKTERQFLESDHRLKFFNE
jgi:hypothetical protein